MRSLRIHASLQAGKGVPMQKVEYKPARPFDFRHEQFERLGLRTTAHEPLHVYCLGCGVEIDPLKRQSWGPRSWWLCPRGCNGGVH